jgi:hypothetical protein
MFSSFCFLNSSNSSIQLWFDSSIATDSSLDSDLFDRIEAVDQVNHDLVSSLWFDTELATMAIFQSKWLSRKQEVVSVTSNEPSPYTIVSEKRCVTDAWRGWYSWIQKLQL